MNTPISSKILKALLYIIFIAGTMAVLTLPWMLEQYTGAFYDAYYLEPGYKIFITAFMMIVGSLGLWIVGELIVMLRTISSGPFIERNYKALKRMGVASMLTAFLFFAKCLQYVTILTLVCGVLLLVCGLVAFTLCDLFRQAVRYKEENDLTI